MTPLLAHIAWERGGQARILTASAAAVSLVSSVPWPPGSRVSGSLLDAPHATLRIKVHASRGESDGTFRIDGRPLDLTRELRERLEVLVAGRG